MTNYERKKNMTIEEMAKDGVCVKLDSDPDFAYITSDGKYFYDRETATEHEIDWLKQEAEDE